MLEVNFDAELKDGMLKLSVHLTNLDQEKIMAACRAPFGSEDSNQLYVSGTAKPEVVHLLLGNPAIPSHLNIYQPLTAFHRVLEERESVVENFSIPVPLKEAAPYQRPKSDEPWEKTPIPLSQILLTVHWTPEASVGKRMPVEGNPGLWEAWYSDQREQRATLRAPSGLSLLARKEPFFRF